jgi:hypothetical protein
MVRSKRMLPKVRSVSEWKWNQTAVPDVSKRAAIAPVRGQGLGSTMWYACAWCAIKRFLVNRGLGVRQKRRLESWLRRFREG